MKRINLVLSLLLICTVTVSYADSPITSTDFYKAYLDDEMVLKASNNNGALTQEFCEYLNDNNIDIANKLALINAISWDYDGQNNFNIYQNYLIKNVRKIKEKNFLKKCSTEQLICLAYLKAMDDYFNVDAAYLIAQTAIDKGTNSYSIHIVYGLIKAQYEFNDDWCETFKATDDVRKNNSLEIDMNADAIKIIFDYMDLYRDDC